MRDPLEGYATAARSDLVARFEAINSLDLYKPVFDLFPKSPVRVADIGAGTGRDAAWFAAQGHSVVAVEPVDELRLSGMALHPSADIEWLKDQLPELRLSRDRGPFDLIILSAVWQHLDSRARSRAMHTLAKLASARCLLVMSLRHGPGAPDRPVFPADSEDTIRNACQLGFRLVRNVDADSRQAGNRSQGVWWTWLAFARG